ncbi:MAG TPA: LamG-like jellyroll fold domain-containing protein, partial [Phycisphaerae bacterium]|nr:LamG-like jellyroll fold domain-containing protein [Phycisphaerae bacterium]
MTRACGVTAVLVCAAAALGDQDPRRIERDWRVKYERNPIATYVGIEGDRVVLRLPDGSQRKVELWMLEGRELAYLQRQRCALPEGTRRVEPPDDGRALIDLSAETLPAGPLKRWQNAGTLGGGFHALVTPPTVEAVAGRKAVRFEYGPAIVAMDLNTMAADFLAPQAISDGESFTVAAWLYNPGVPQDVETFLSWHTLGGDDGTDIRFGKRGRYSFLKGAYCGPMGTMGFPGDDLGRANAWHHVAHVFTGGPDGEMRLYLDGRLVATKVFERAIRIRPADGIAADSARLNGELRLREEGEVTVRFYLGRRDGHHWARIYGDEPDRWNRLLEVTRGASGAVSVKADKLAPGTDYVYRIQLHADDEHVYWSDGIGRFRTAGADGTPGEAHPKETRRHVFLGSSWGSTWDWTTAPRHYYTGAIAGLKVFGRALEEREVRALFGTEQAYAPSPADGGRIEGLEAALAWKPCADGVKGCRVYLGTDREAVAAGRAEALRGEVAEPKLPAGKLAFATTYYWRVDERVGASGRVVPGEVWSFSTPDGQATAPTPADGAEGVNVQTVYLTWTPGEFARRQTVYLDTDREAVVGGTARHTMPRGGRDGEAHFPLTDLEHGRTYWWRVEAQNRDGLPDSKGRVWSFTVEDFVKGESDGVVSEPYPRGVRQWGRVTKFMEGGGQPIIAADDTPDLAMRRARKTCLKVLEKRPDLHYRLAVSNTAGSLTAERELGWTELVRNTYGATRNMLLDQNFYGGANMLMHEMGHQLHMNGMSNLEMDFDHRLHETWLAGMKSLKYLGHYGANNMWEYIACAANLYINDGHRDDEVYPREQLRRDDPYLYFLLNEFWS